MKKLVTALVLTAMFIIGCSTDCQVRRGSNCGNPNCPCPKGQCLCDPEDCECVVLAPQAK